MHIDILSPEENLYSGEIEYIKLPGQSGSFEVLNNHAPLISALKEGKVIVRGDDGVQEFKIKSGIVEVLNNKVSVLTEGLLDD
ncbi:MAG: ATP synthase F1 subunit epsilon [Chitinophagales bacterium]